MNDLTTGQVVVSDDTKDLKIYDGSGLVTISTDTSPANLHDMIGSITIGSTGNNYGTFIMDDLFNYDDFLDTHIMNRVTIDHKVQEQELMKLKEVAPDYANEIKETLAKNATRDIIKKITFTKKHDKDADVHHFIGRVWCFTEEELKNLIKEVRNA